MSQSEQVQALNQLLKPKTSAFHIYFLRHKRGGNLIDRLITLATKLSYRAFGRHELELGHVVIQLGSHCYEMNLYGTFSYVADRPIVENPRAVAYYELEITEDEERAIRYVLDETYVKPGIKLSAWENLSYFVFWVWANLCGFDEAKVAVDDRNSVADGVFHFHLPATCMSLANTCLRLLLGRYDLAPASHLPPNLLFFMSRIHVGELYVRL
jgi:hypothetical protein